MQHLSHDDGNTANSSDRVAYQRVAQTVWGTRHIDDAVLRRWRRSTASWSGPAAPMDPLDGGTWWYCTDARFSPVALLDAGGKVAERVRYDAYGNALHHHGLDADGDRDADSGDAAAINALRGSWIGTGPLTIAASVYRAEYDLDRNGVINGSDVLLAQSAAAAALPAGWVSASGPAGGPDSIVGYGGYIFNRETMYYTVRHRHYSPALGRFLERDPAGYIDGSNLFEYCGGGPLSWLDPWGLNRTWRDDAVDGIRAIGDWLFGDPGKEHAEWLNAVERDSGGRRRSICERYWRGEITAEEAQRLLDGETALVDGAHGLGEIVDAQADLIQEISINVALTVPAGAIVKVLEHVGRGVIAGSVASLSRIAPVAQAAVFHAGIRLGGAIGGQIGSAIVRGVVRVSGGHIWAGTTFTRYMSSAELVAVAATGLLRGGNAGRTYFTDAVYRSAEAAQRALSLPVRPEVGVQFRLLPGGGRIRGPMRVRPGHGQPGGGREFYSPDPVRVIPLRVWPLSFFLRYHISEPVNLHTREAYWNRSAA